MLRRTQNPVLTRLNRPSLPHFGTTNPQRDWTMVMTEHHRDRAFDVDEKGRYWRIRPLKKFYNRSKDRTSQDPRVGVNHSSASPNKNTPSIFFGAEGYDPVALDEAARSDIRRLETEMRERAEEEKSAAEERLNESKNGAQDDDDDHVLLSTRREQLRLRRKQIMREMAEGKSSTKKFGQKKEAAKISSEIMSSSFITRPVKMVRASKFGGQGSFGPLAFHHFLHGVRGLNNDERRPLLVRGAIPGNHFFDSMQLGTIQQQVVAQSTQKNNNNNNSMNWITISDIITSGFTVPFAVTPHVKIEAATTSSWWEYKKLSEINEDKLITKSNNDQETKITSSSTMQPLQDIKQTTILNPVSPFSRAAKHARLVGKPVGLGAANNNTSDEPNKQDSVSTLSMQSDIVMGKSSNNENNNMNNKQQKMDVAWQPSTSVDDDINMFETILVGGDETSIFLCELSTPTMTLSNNVQTVLLASRDALYVPRGWTVKLSARVNFNNHTKEDAERENESLRSPPIVFKFSYSPIFPETGKNKMNIFSNNGNIKNNNKFYLASEFMMSFGDFYKRPREAGSKNTRLGDMSGLMNQKSGNNGFVFDAQSNGFKPMNV